MVWLLWLGGLLLVPIVVLIAAVRGALVNRQTDKCVTDIIIQRYGGNRHLPCDPIVLGLVLYRVWLS